MSTHPDNEPHTPEETTLADRVRGARPSHGEMWSDDPTLLVAPLGVFAPRPVIDPEEDLSEEGSAIPQSGAKDWETPQPIHQAVAKELARASATTDGMGNPMAEEALRWVRNNFPEELRAKPLAPPEPVAPEPARENLPEELKTKPIAPEFAAPQPARNSFPEQLQVHPVPAETGTPRWAKNSLPEALRTEGVAPEKEAEEKVWPGTIVGEGGVFPPPAEIDRRQQAARSAAWKGAERRALTFEEFVAKMEAEERAQVKEPIAAAPALLDSPQATEERAEAEEAGEAEDQAYAAEEEAYLSKELAEDEAAVDAPIPVEDEPIERMLFQSWITAEIPPKPRIPHLGHLLVLLILAFVGLFGASLLTRSALSFHLFGVATVQMAQTDVHYTIGSMAAMYSIMLVGSLIVFPLLWHKGLFAGMHWQADTAFRMRGRLVAAAAVCFVLAMADEVLLPGPANAPIDKMFASSTAAWILFFFGVTVAPFFEEILFRGFLLPALCTALDWLAEKASGNPAPSLDAYGHPRWSIPAMVFASIATSVPFAGMHAEQTGYSLGPFVLLIAVSLVLCWARLSTRSLAASVMVHATYNFMLFSLMLIGTGGFQHLDKM